MDDEKDLIRLAAMRAWLSPIDAEALLALTAGMTDQEAADLWEVSERACDRLVGRELKALRPRGGGELKRAHFDIAEAVVAMGVSEHQGRYVRRIYGNGI